MNTFISLIPAIPLASFLIIVLFGNFISKRIIAFIGSGSIVLSALITIVAGIEFLKGNNILSYTVVLWRWIDTGGFCADIALRLDALSLVFCFVITFVGALIHIYSVEFMSEDDGFTRFFAFMNLFVASMLILVLADNLLVLYSGWEGVGLCSYLLIGFYYKDSANGYAARKAFIVTRVGDTFMIIGLFLLFFHLGTLNISELMHKASSSWIPDSPVAILSTVLLLGGALGKSAQLPLQTWLPDAMAGPSPVSALIHAATMVTAGVYLIARTHILFALAPSVQLLTGLIGATTLLLAGFSALTQHDLKRILAYSTISQIGYMFLALGIGAWSAAIFHFMIHAFFKALLFLSGGAVILLLNDEHDIFKMGGLWKKMPVIFITFLAGALSLSALPLISAGFFSKDQILWYAWSANNGNIWLWAAGIAGALLTSLYSFRLIFIVFFGEIKTQPSRKLGLLIIIPLIVLAILSFGAGYIELPENFGNFHLFSNLINTILPAVTIKNASTSEILFQVLAAIFSLSGIYFAYLFYFKKPGIGYKFSGTFAGRLFYNGWGFDKLYQQLIINPVVWLSEIDRNDVIDIIYISSAKITNLFSLFFRKTQNGKLRWYVLVITFGIVIIITLMLYF